MTRFALHSAQFGGNWKNRYASVRNAPAGVLRIGCPMVADAVTIGVRWMTKCQRGFGSLPCFYVGQAKGIVATIELCEEYVRVERLNTHRLVRTGLTT